MNMKIDKAIQGKFEWLPYRIFRSYILLTLLLALFGPIKYDMDLFYTVLMVIYMLAFLLITRIAMNSATHYVSHRKASSRDYFSLMFILKVAILLCLGIKSMLVISSVSLYGVPSFDNFFITLANVYTEMHNGEFIGNIYRQIDTFCTFIFYFAMFVGIFWFRKLGFIFKSILIVDISLDMIYQILYIGTQRSLITIAILFLAMIAQSAIKENYHVDKRKIAKIIGIVIVSLVVVMNILSARKGIWDANYYTSSSRYDFEHLLLIPFVSQKAKYDVCTVISYLTQGYYGITLSFQVPFEWTYFLGSVRGLNSIITQLIPQIPDMSLMTYPVRAGELFHVNGFAYWYTAFPWLASDFTFVGALLIMGIVGKLYMKTWIQTVKYKNPLAFMVFTLLTIEYIFIIANNQLFIQRGESLATIVLLIVYGLFNKKFNFHKDSELK